MIEGRVVFLSSASNTGLAYNMMKVRPRNLSADTQLLLGENVTVNPMTIHHTLVKYRSPTKWDIHAFSSSD